MGVGTIPDDTGNAPLKVLHVLPSISLKHGGPSFAVRSMAQGLAQKGIHVDIASTNDDGDGRRVIPTIQPETTEGYQIWTFPFRTFYRISMPMTQWLRANIVGYDLLHIHYMWSYPGLPAAYFANQAQVPYIVRPLGAFSRWGMKYRRPVMKRISYRLIERRIIDKSAMIHYTSAQERLEAEEVGITKSSSIVPLGVNISAFERSLSTNVLQQTYPSLRDRKVILFLSRIDRKKGLDLLLPAFARVLRNYPEALLLVVGDGDPVLVTQFKELAQRLEISNDIIWAGFLVGEEKLAAFASADIFVLPSYTENFGIVVVEAMASGLPVVVSDQVAIAPEIAAANAGIVVTLDERILAEALIELNSKPELRQFHGNNGRILARNTFSQEKMIGNMLQMYKDAIDSAKVSDAKFSEANSSMSKEE